jgi:hypothetical protein
MLRFAERQLRDVVFSSTVRPLYLDKRSAPGCSWVFDRLTVDAYPRPTAATARKAMHRDLTRTGSPLCIIHPSVQMHVH